jgi:poly-beta-1,6-N-acetyl-D-glucosamine synthase
MKSKPDPFAKWAAENLTIIVPAYNEEESIEDTVKSLLEQTCPPKQVIVVDDCSNDNTGILAVKAGSTVHRGIANTGTKAGAQNFALSTINTKFTMAIDGDTTLAPDAVEKLMVVFKEKGVAAACGSVIPRFRKTLWERGRYIEYLMAFTFYKPIQNYFGKPLISSGCFSAYKTSVLKKLGGWQTRTMAEDMDLTWTLYSAGYKVKFIPEAVSYPIEPNNFEFMRKQLRRWSHGFMQNVLLHGKNVIQIPYLNLIITVGLWDAIIASLAYTLFAPLMSIYFKNPIFLLAYIIDAPAIFVPVIFKGIERREVKNTILSFPSFFVLRFVNCYFLLEAFASEIIFKKRLLTYEKGH